MKRLILGFLGAVLVPCAVLAWLSIRALKAEQADAEHQQVQLAHEKTAHTALRLKQQVAEIQEKWEGVVKANTFAGAPGDTLSKSIAEADLPIAQTVLLDLKNGIVPRPDLAADKSYSQLIQAEAPFLEAGESFFCYHSVPTIPLPAPMLALQDFLGATATGGLGGNPEPMTGTARFSSGTGGDGMTGEKEMLGRNPTEALGGSLEAVAPPSAAFKMKSVPAATATPATTTAELADRGADLQMEFNKADSLLEKAADKKQSSAVPKAKQAPPDVRSAGDLAAAPAGPERAVVPSDRGMLRRSMPPAGAADGASLAALEKQSSAPSAPAPMAAARGAEPAPVALEVKSKKDSDSRWLREKAANFETENAASKPRSGKGVAPQEAATPTPSVALGEVMKKELASPLQELTETRKLAAKHPTPEQLAAAGSISSLKAASVSFADLWAVAESGSFARTLENGEIRLVWWVRAATTPLVCLAYVDIPRLTASLEESLPKDDPDFFHSLIDAAGNARLSSSGATKPLEQPFASEELGLALPKWETALFLRDPTKLLQIRQSAQWRLGLPLLAVLAAAVAGAWLLWVDAARQRREARTKTDFVSQVSHELRTPLTSIRMFSDLLAKSAEPDPEKTRKYAAIISDESSRLSRLVDQVLDFARIERGTLDLACRTLDLNILASETVQSYLPQLESQGFNVRIHCAATPILVSADPDRMAQLLLNLLNNAEKYGAGASREIDVEITSSPGPQVSVMDRGPGIPKGEEKRIFEKFHRANNNLDNPINGSGLGLSLAKEIARAHGGELSYCPRDGGGSVFTASFPTAPSPSGLQ